jgi:hypothetical protein
MFLNLDSSDPQLRRLQRDLRALCRRHKPMAVLFSATGTLSNNGVERSNADIQALVSMVEALGKRNMLPEIDQDEVKNLVTAMYRCAFGVTLLSNAWARLTDQGKAALERDVVAAMRVGGRQVEALIRGDAPSVNIDHEFPDTFGGVASDPAEPREEGTP